MAPQPCPANVRDSYDPESDFVVIDHRECDTNTNTAAHLNPELTHLDEISAFIDNQVADDLWPVNKTIHDHPELGYHEVLAHDTLTAFMRTRPGWKVTPSVCGIKTAWTAVYNSGGKGPVVSFNAEMDALPTIGHACGHNLIASSSVAAALATAHILSLPPTHNHPGGKVLLIGTPAEEGGGGKIKLLRAGLYTSHKASISLLAHPGTAPDSALVHTTAYARMRAEYRGREAHAAAEPWKGINALDGLVTAYGAVGLLRQQTMPGDLVQGCIREGGLMPNVIHGFAAGEFVVRARTGARLRELRGKVEGCLRAGAVASGAGLEVRRLGEYMDHVPNRGLGGRYARWWNELVRRDYGDGEGGGWRPVMIPLDQDVDEGRGMSGASSDQGDVSYALPSLMPGFSIPVGEDDVGPHNPGFAKAAGTKEAFKACLRVAKALAGTAVDVLRREGLLDGIKREWEEGPGSTEMKEMEV